MLDPENGLTPERAALIIGGCLFCVLLLTAMRRRTLLDELETEKKIRHQLEDAGREREKKLDGALDTISRLKTRLPDDDGPEPAE